MRRAYHTWRCEVNELLVELYNEVRALKGAHDEQGHALAKITLWLKEAIETQATQERVDKARADRESRAAAEAAELMAGAHEARELHMGEVVVRRMKESLVKGSLMLAEGAPVTLHQENGKDTLRVWGTGDDGHKFRTVSEAWVKSRSRAVASDARVVNKSASAAKAAAIVEYHKAQAQATPAPTGITPAPKAKAAVTKKLEKWAARHTQAAGSGACGCKSNWLCLAARALGKRAQQVGSVRYEPGDYVVKFTVMPGSTLAGKVLEEGGSQEWGL